MCGGGGGGGGSALNTLFSTFCFFVGRAPVKYW